jgi:HemY protein
VRLADWNGLKALLPNMRKARLLNAEQAAQFEKNIYCELLRAAGKKDAGDIQRIWIEIPRGVKKNPDVVYAYVQQLLLTQAPTKDIEELVRKTLNHQWQADLARLYGSFPFDNLNRQLVIVGAWLKMYGPKPELLLTLGRLCVRVQLWGKAKDYFEKCLSQGPNAEASLAYGNLLEQLGDSNAAMQKYKAGLVS